MKTSLGKLDFGIQIGKRPKRLKKFLTYFCYKRQLKHLIQLGFQF